MLPSRLATVSIKQLRGYIILVFLLDPAHKLQIDIFDLLTHATMPYEKQQSLRVWQSQKILFYEIAMLLLIARNDDKKSSPIQYYFTSIFLVFPYSFFGIFIYNMPFSKRASTSSSLIFVGKVIERWKEP